MDKDIKVYYLGPLIMVLFLFSFVSPVFASSTTKQTNYIDKYFEIDQDGHWKMNIYLGDQILSTIDDTGHHDLSSH